MSLKSTSLIAAVIVALGSPALTQASPFVIDGKLLPAAAELRDQLLAKKFKNVGVLKFEVINGSARPAFNAGLLNNSMAHRLEMALVYHNEAGKLNIIKDASAVAYRANKKINLTSEAGRKQLFEYRYPLHWGSETVKPDVFVTGVVRVGYNKEGKADPDKTTVRLAYFTAANPTRVLEASDGKDLLRFEVPTTRQLLAQSGVGFMSTKAAVRATTAADREKLLVRRPNGRKSPVDTSTSQLAISIVYNGTAHQPQMGTEGEGQLSVPCPELNDQVTMLLVNQSPDRQVGVVVTVNGTSTLYREPDCSDPLSMSRWIIGPGQTLEVKGFLQPGATTYEPFRVISPEAMLSGVGQLEQNEQLGMIQVHEIQEGATAPDSQIEIGLGSQLEATKGAKRPQTAREAAGRIKTAFSLKPKGKNFIIGEGQLPINVTDGRLENPFHAGTYSIRYARLAPNTP